MKIQIKLMGMLKDKTPHGGVLDLVEGSTIRDALTAVGVDPQQVQAFSLGGAIERNRERELRDGDELVVLAPVGGG